jgi:3-deoxy-D-manno-octulosonic-acid transferase
VDARAAALGLGAGGPPVFVAGSTHEGEDGPVVEAWRAAGGGSASRLVLVPRHLDRLKEIARLLKRLEAPFVLRSQAGPGRDSGTILLVDTMGELETLFGLADVVFLGGSLVPVGGHNVLEPAVAGCPVLVGPCTETCRRETEILAAAGGLLVVRDGADLGGVLGRLLADGSARRRMGERAREAASCLRGAAAADVRLLAEAGLLADRGWAGAP